MQIYGRNANDPGSYVKSDPLVKGSITTNKVKRPVSVNRNRYSFKKYSSVQEEAEKLMAITEAGRVASHGEKPAGTDDVLKNKRKTLIKTCGP